MQQLTKKLWDKQNRHEGDRLRLFAAVAAHLGPGARSVLYPGSYVDVAASFAFERVIYSDMDARAPKFFADAEGVAEIIAAARVSATPTQFAFVPGDYTLGLGLELELFDVLVSLYAGFISEFCTEYLRVGGTLLVNPSHGDAAMASIDPRYRLSGVVLHSGGKYTVRTDGLERYLVPKRPTDVTVELLHRTHRGVGYTKPAFAYLFTRVA